MLRFVAHNSARGIRKAPSAYASVHRSCNKTARPSPEPFLADKKPPKSAFAAVAPMAVAYDGPAKGLHCDVVPVKWIVAELFRLRSQSAPTLEQIVSVQPRHIEGMSDRSDSVHYEDRAH